MNNRLLEMTYGERFMKARRLNNWTQQQLAERLGIDRKTVLAIEADKRTPKKSVVIAWSVVTGVPLEWLETGTVTAPDTEAITGRYLRPRPYDLPLFVLDAAA